ncbi:MAG: S8 family serine peptidase [Sphingomonas sp.]
MSSVADYRAIASFSSRGPLRDFSQPPGSVPLLGRKPDIAAPGVDLEAALAADSDPLALRTGPWTSGIRSRPMSGTSMASPMIAGVVALMLDKQPALNVGQVRTLLAGVAQAGTDPTGSPAAERAFGAGIVDTLATHNSTT